MSDEQCVLQVSGLSKTFPGVVALSKFDFQLHRGEIHGLLGENGAGKSTFIKLLNGLFVPDCGTFIIEKERLERIDPTLIHQKGVKFVHQELSVFPYLTITDNVCMNDYPKTVLGTIDWKKARRNVAALLEDYNLALDPDTKLSKLSIGQRQLIEIIASVSKNAKVVVLDEPTASLGDTEKNKLFEVMRSLRGRGISVIFISHILEEVLAICDRITVVRDGRRVGTYNNEGLTKDFLIEKIVGAQIEESAATKARTLSPGGSPALELSGLSYKGFFSDVSLTVHCGEIVGVLGLLGSGKTEMADICFGLAKPSAGHISVDGTRQARMTPLKAIRSGIGYVTEDRQRSGVFELMSVLKNCSISIIERLRGFLGVVDRAREARSVGDAISSLGIRIASLDQEVRQLSGGNQQKVLLGRWLIANQKTLIFDEPTKGVDVGARSEFYRILRDLRDKNHAILVLTSDHREALTVSDRLFLLMKGKLVEYGSMREATPKDVLSRLTGG
jgi:ribose transport system ATP-binding protein